MTLLPDYSVVDDPLQRSGVVTTRPLEDDVEVSLVLLRRRRRRSPLAVRALIDALVQRAYDVSERMGDPQPGKAKVVTSVRVSEPDGFVGNG